MIQEFASGETMHEFLRSEACKLAFTPVVERSIEAKHSLISRRVQKNWRSGRIVSLTLRVPDIKAEMAADATYLQTLVEAFAQTRDPMQAARQLGIQEHPDLVNAVFDRWHHARVTGIVNRIVYRCDLQSKFESHAAARAGHDRETGKRARLAQREMQRIWAFQPLIMTLWQQPWVMATHSQTRRVPQVLGGCDTCCKAQQLSFVPLGSNMLAHDAIAVDVDGVTVESPQRLRPKRRRPAVGSHCSCWSWHEFLNKASLQRRVSGWRTRMHREFQTKQELPMWTRQTAGPSPLRR